MNAIYKMDADCGRMGNLRGVFIADKEMVEELITSQTVICFGEVLGKHSDVRCTLDRHEITMVTDNPEHVELISTLDLATGFNPFNYPADNIFANELGLGDDRIVYEVIEFLLKEGNDGKDL